MKTKPIYISEECYSDKINELLKKMWVKGYEPYLITTTYFNCAITKVVIIFKLIGK